MMNILKMHAWLWNDKVKVKVHFEDLIHSILPVAFQKRLPPAADNVRVPVLPMSSGAPAIV